MVLKPLVFVAMPFGVKVKNARTKIDFDDIYEKGIKPVTKRVDVDLIRADEEKSGGFIHVPMYERLLLAETVIADLTMANPNVFYELGIRHCARPKSTILIFAEGVKLPFDVSPLRAIPYKLKDGKLPKSETEKLLQNITARLQHALGATSGPDSPLFQLIDKFPGVQLPHEVTESFRDRVKYIDSMRMELEHARKSGNIKEGEKLIIEIERKIGDFSIAPPELLIDLILSYRDVSAWDQITRVVPTFPEGVRNLTTVQEQLAMALNRRNHTGDRDEAIRILRHVIDKNGLSPETCGILGRVYKDIYSDAQTSGKKGESKAALSEAIKFYTLGFEEDPRDYYPGINALTLLVEKGDRLSKKEIERLYPLVSFAIARRGGLSSDDYWDIATVLELAVIGKDWNSARRSTGKLLLIGKSLWNFETTHRNLTLLRDSMASKGNDVAPLNKILNDIASKMKAFTRTK
jgi:hypothetical protein